MTMQREDHQSLRTQLLSIKFSGDSKMIASQKRFGRHLVTKTVAERDFATRSRGIDDSQKLSLHRLKLERTKVWDDLRRINVKTRSLKRASLIEREIRAERNKLENQMQEQPPSQAAIGNHLAASLVITGVRPQPRPVAFRDQDGRVIRPKTSASPRVALSARQIDALRPKTAGPVCSSVRLERDAQELLPPAMSRKLLKAERLADSLDTLQIRHYLSPEELAVLEREKMVQRRAKSCQPFSVRLRRHVTGSVPMRSSYDDVTKIVNSTIMDTDSIQPKRLLSRERNLNNLRRKSLSLDDIRKPDLLKVDAELQEEIGRRVQNGEQNCDIEKGSVKKQNGETAENKNTKKLTSEKVVKLPSPELDHDDEAENET